MRRNLFLGAVLAVLLAAAGGSGTRGRRTRGRRRRRRAHILDVTLTNTKETDLPRSTAGPGVGDRFIVFGDIVLDGKPVGAGGYECVTVRFKPGSDPKAQPGGPRPTSAPPPSRSRAVRSPCGGS